MKNILTFCIYICIIRYCFIFLIGKMGVEENNRIYTKQEEEKERGESKEIAEILKNNEIKHILIEMFTSYKECNMTPEEIETRVSWNCSDLSETKRSEICTKAKVWSVLIEKLETEKE